MHRTYLFVFLVTFTSPLLAREYVTVVGSNVIYPFMTVIIERFHREQNLPAPIAESTGTGGGIKSFCAGLEDNYPDIVVSARPMSASEKEYCAKHDIKDPLELELGFDAPVLVTFEQPFSITLDELRKGLSQNIERWDQLNPKLPQKKIKIMGPAITAGVYDAFVELVLKPYHLHMRQDRVYVEVIGHEKVVIKKLELNPKYLGLLSFTFLSQLQDKLKPLQINGITPTIQTIRSGAYPLVRKSYLYVKQSRLGFVKSLAPFLRYIFDESVSGAQGYLGSYGFIPLDVQSHREEQEKLLQALQHYQNQATQTEKKS